MALPWRTISEDVINISKVLNDLMDTTVDKDVLWVVRDQLGNVIEKEIPNLSKLINIFNRRYLGVFASPPENRPDNSPIQPGDYYLDLNKKRLVYFDGENWLDILPATDDSSGDMSILTGDTPPSENTGVPIGTLYIDYSTRKLYVAVNAYEDESGNPITDWELVDGVIRDYITPLPVISGPTTVIEQTTNEYIIENFSKDTHYSIVANRGSIEYNVGDDRFYYTAPVVDYDHTDQISVTVSEPGKLTNTEYIRVNVLNINEEDDDLIVNNEPSAYNYETDGLE